MIHQVVLEKLDANMEQATVGAWRVAEGAAIAVGEPLVELITDKITFDYECPVAGTVRRLAAAAGSVVPVGYCLALVGDATTALPDIDPTNRRLVEEHKRRQEVAISVGDAPPAARPAVSSERVRATPAARRLAKQHGLDLASVSPAEPGGIVGEEDVRRHLES
ncbi:MAG: E3 binding domain-containing protein [Fimbriimonadaceae bacterium]|nr:E3 binding domain-containing protein [Fimbriimonadaceae bacterium]